MGAIIKRITDHCSRTGEYTAKWDDRGGLITTHTARGPTVNRVVATVPEPFRYPMDSWWTSFGQLHYINNVYDANDNRYCSRNSGLSESWQGTGEPAPKTGADNCVRLFLWRRLFRME